MDWIQFSIFFAGVGGLFVWARTESRSDHRELETWTKSMIILMQQEMKDFHGRLCAIEERHRK